MAGSSSCVAGQAEAAGEAGRAGFISPYGDGPDGTQTSVEEFLTHGLAVCRRMDLSFNFLFVGRLW